MALQSNLRSLGYPAKQNVLWCDEGKSGSPADSDLVPLRNYMTLLIRNAHCRSRLELTTCASGADTLDKVCHEIRFLISVPAAANTPLSLA